MRPLSQTLSRCLIFLLVALGLGLLVMSIIQGFTLDPTSSTAHPATQTARPSTTTKPALPAGAALDLLGRLTQWPGKTQVSCPAQDPNTAVILILGQTHAANHAALGPPRSPQSGVINWSQSRCYLASAPLLGATGQANEPWTLMADQLLASQQFNAVILAPIAILNSSISRWVPGGDIDQYLVQDVRALQNQYRTTHVIWLQGESDFMVGTPEDKYRTSLMSVVNTLRSVGVRAPVYISTSTRCGTPWRAENSVALAQTKFINPDKQIVSGVNMDQLLSSDDRIEACHLSAKGVLTTATAWSQRLIQP